jgi:RNA polymerase sigma factor (sigma-70 family)
MARPSTDPAARDASSPELRAFVRARRRGDEALMRSTWRDLLASEWSRIRAFAAARRSPALPNGHLTPEEVDELAQAVVVRLIDKLHFEGESIGELRAFLLQATKYAFLDHLRAHIDEDRRRAGSFDDRGDDETPGVGGRLDAEASALVVDTLDRVVDRAVLDEAFAAMDEDKREVFLAMAGGEPAAEIAERLGISVANVYQRNRRGLVQLQGLLKDQLR